MRYIEKDLNSIPECLSNSTTKEHFQKVIADKKFENSNRYKCKDVKEKLEEIYHTKCAFCEKSLLDTDRHIDHFRPKNGGYYWLSFSWDNLIMACAECNRQKKNDFPISKTKAEYQNEDFQNIHNLSLNYDGLEEPKLINPERDRNYIEEIKFSNRGEISSDNERVSKTIETCELYRKELNQKREKIFRDFKNRINRHFNKLPILKDDIEEFIQNSTEKDEFYLFRQFIINNLDLFFEENKNLSRLLAIIRDKIV